MRNIYLLSLSFIFVMGFASGLIQDLPDYTRIGDCVNLIQIDNVSTETVVSIVTPERIIHIGQNMSKNGTFFNYTFCGNNVSGGYTVNGIDNTGVVWAYDWFVNAQGKAYSSIEGIVYAILIFLLLVLTLLSLWMTFYINGENGRNADGSLAGINYKKYLKILLFCISYVCALGLSYFAWNLSYGILEFNEMANFFYFLFRVQFVLMLVGFPLLFTLSIINYVKEKKWEGLLDRGLTVK